MNYLAYFKDENDIRKAISNSVIKIRENNNLTQQKLAEMLEVSVEHISRIESGCYVPSLTTFFDLVNVLKIDLQEFGFGVNETTNPIKNELLNKISSATDLELIFYNNVFNAICSSLEETKRK